MTDKLTTLIIVFIHVIMRTTIFIEQSSTNCSPAPSVASWIFLISMLLFSSDLNFCPYKGSTSRAFLVFFESVINTLFIEVATIVVWCSLERIFYKAIKCVLLQSSSNMYYDMGGDSLVGVLLTAFSILVFLVFFKVTQYELYFRKKFKIISKRFDDSFKKIFGRFHEFVERNPASCGQPAMRNSEADREDGWCFGNLNRTTNTNTPTNYMMTRGRCASTNRQMQNRDSSPSRRCCRK